jgi:hypothetical protein
MDMFLFRLEGEEEDLLWWVLEIKANLPVQ